MLAVCESCDTPLYRSEDLVRHETTAQIQNRNETVRVLCKPCALKNEARILRVENAEIVHNRNRMWLWGGIGFGAWMLPGLLFAIAGGEALWLVITLVPAVLTFILIACIMLDNNFVGELFMDISGWGIKSFPGIIFTFDVDGLLFLIGMRILFGVIACVTTIAAFLLAVVIGVVCGIFAFPFAITKSFCDTKKKLAEAASLEKKAIEYKVAE